MSWIKKNVEVLGFEVEEPNRQNFLETFHYHKRCLPEDEEYPGKITDHITKETLEKNPDHKLLCDRCGEEIK